MAEITINLGEITNTASISGRTVGENYAKQISLLELIENDNTIVVEIPATIYAINDSFWKGFFTELFKVYKTKEKVKSFFRFETHDFNKMLIDKTLTILEAIHK